MRLWARWGEAPGLWLSLYRALRGDGLGRRKAAQWAWLMVKLRCLVVQRVKIE